jgi:hypothetical protein
MELRGLYRIKSLHGIPYVEKRLRPPLDELEWDLDQVKDLTLRPRHHTTAS